MEYGYYAHLWCGDWQKYDQDHVVLEAQQRAIDRNPRSPFYNLNIDAGALWARRLIDGMLAREQGTAGAPRAAE